MIKKLLYKDGQLNIRLLFWAGLLLIMLLRCFYFGVDYFNYLDDNNTYGVFYRRNGDIWNNIVLWYGLYTFRPVAYLLDAYVTQWFWPCMWLVLLFYTVMHFITVYLFHAIMKRLELGFGAFGIILISLTPILLEAVYWIGASTRLVPGMFLSILSVYFLVRYVQGVHGNKALLFGYLSTNLLSTGFYEQIVVFNLVFTLFVVLYLWRDMLKEKLLLALTPVFSTLAIGAYYIAFWSSGKQSARGALTQNLLAHGVLTTKGVGNILLRQQPVSYIQGMRGFADMDKTPAQWIVFLFICLMALGMVYYGIKRGREKSTPGNKRYFLRMAAGIILAIAPFGPFYMLQNNYMSFRAVYPSVFGIAMVLDTAADWVGENIRFKPLGTVIAAIVIIPFFMINVAEIHNYKMIEQDDDLIIENLLAAFKETGMDEETPVVVFNAGIRYSDTSSPRYENISSSDWALIGKANAVSEEFYFKTMFPIRDGMAIGEEYVANKTASALFALNSDLSVDPVKIEDGLLQNYSGSVLGSFEDIGGGIFIYRASE